MTESASYTFLGDAEKIERLRKGQPLVFPEFSEDESRQDKIARTLKACWISELADQQTRRVTVPIRVKNAIIEFSLDMHYREFEQEIQFEDCHFAGEVRFDDCLFLSSVTFSKSLFLNDVHFTDSTLKRVASFVNTEFHSKVRFSRTTFTAQAYFTSARFRRGAFFLSARFQEDAYFSGAQFFELAAFHSMTAQSSITFDDAIFKSGLSLNRARCHSVIFRMSGSVEHHASFAYGVFLDGFTFEHLEADWKKLFEHLEGSPQPFVQLEKLLRIDGRDAEADRLYKNRRRLEGKLIHLRSRPLAWIWDRSFWLLAGYGVRIWPLIMIPVLLWLYGGKVYRNDGALVNQKLENVAAEARRTLNCSEAHSTATTLAVSFRIATKLDLPVASCWEPSNKYFTVNLLRNTYRMTYSEYASLQMLCSWIVLPFILATIAERVRRRPR